MSSMRLVSGSNGQGTTAHAPGLRRLSSMAAGARGVVHHVHPHGCGRVDRLHALGVTAGAVILVLQTFPGVVFQCDQTELAVERSVADLILITPAEG